MTTKSPTRFYRDPERGIIMGVCAGLADYFDIRLGVVRALVILGMIFTGFWPFAIGYFVIGFMLDVKPRDLYRNEEDEEFWRQTRKEPEVTTADLRRRFRDIRRRTSALERCLTSSRFQLEREINSLKD